MKKFILLLIVTAAGLFAWYQRSLSPVDRASAASHTVTIESGMSTQGIATMLEEQKLIRSAKMFVLYARISGSAGGLKAGTFVLSPSLSAAEIIKILEEGRTQQVSITIPEGFTVQDIDDLLSEQGFIAKGTLVSCATSCDFSSYDFLPNGAELAKRGGRVEGYLFPDTYNIDPASVTASFVMELMLANFRIKVIDVLGSDIASSDRSLHEVITMASLIEEEALTDEERPVVSGILWKRFEAETGLGVDATVRYILAKPSDRITIEDLDVDSSYNTRKYRGLPPGPIANPGLQSIAAALQPQDSPYWYYLHDAAGAIHYAETNDEHNANRERYLR